MQGESQPDRDAPKPKPAELNGLSIDGHGNVKWPEASKRAVCDRVQSLILSAHLDHAWAGGDDDDDDAQRLPFEEVLLHCGGDGVSWYMWQSPEGRVDELVRRLILCWLRSEYQGLVGPAAWPQLERRIDLDCLGLWIDR